VRGTSIEYGRGNSSVKSTDRGRADEYRNPFIQLYHHMRPCPVCEIDRGRADEYTNPIIQLNHNMRPYAKKYGISQYC